MLRLLPLALVLKLLPLAARTLRRGVWAHARWERRDNYWAGLWQLALWQLALWQLALGQLQWRVMP